MLHVIYINININIKYIKLYKNINYKYKNKNTNIMLYVIHKYIFTDNADFIENFLNSFPQIFILEKASFLGPW